VIDTPSLKKSLQYLLPVFALFLAMSTAAMWAQAGGGSMVGTVHDPAGAVVPERCRHDHQHRHQHLTTRWLPTVTAASSIPSCRSAPTKSPCLRQASKKPFRKALRSRLELPHPRHRPPGRPDVAIGGGHRQRATDPDGEQRRRDHGPREALIAQLPLNFSGVIRSPLEFMTLTPGFQGDSTGNAQSQASFKLNGAGTGS
jgi:hypothetical protein